MEKNFFYRKTFNFTYLLMALDIVALLLSSSAVYYHLFGSNIFDNDSYVVALLIAVILVLSIFSSYNLYKSWRGRNAFIQFKVIFSAWATLFVALTILGAVFKVSAIYSRLWLGSWSLLSLLAIFSFRYFFTLILRYFRKKGWNHKDVLIYGSGELAQSVYKRLSTNDWTGFNVVGFVDLDSREDQVGDEYLFDLPVYNSYDLERLVQKLKIHELWITLPLKEEEILNKVLFDLRNSTVDIRYVPDLFGFRLLINQSITDIAGFATVNLNESPMRRGNIILKEIEDRIIGLIILTLVSPLMLLIAIAIKLESRGPIIFKQKRHGIDGKLIKVYKFRSMFVHEEKSGQVTQAQKNDKRITTVGNFLRRTSLDELPQFFNVLQGRMSIVGPRPHAVEHNEFYRDQIDFYSLRHKVKPGITGWAQINGWRGETDTLNKMQKRIEYDLYYIQNWSVWFDLKIIFLTIFKGFFSDKAY